LNYAPQLSGHKVEERLHLEVREQKWWNTNGLGYELDDRGVARFPAGARDVSILHNDQTGSEAHPGHRGSFSGGKTAVS
jgi:hypothetical protein